MNEEGSVVGLNDVNSDLIPKESFFKKNKKLVLSFIISIVILIIVIIVAMISIFLKDDLNKNSNNTNKIGDIICVFNIKSELELTKILGDDFKKSSEFKIVINEKEIKYSKIYQFPNTGNNQVKFSLLEEIWKI